MCSGEKYGIGFAVPIRDLCAPHARANFMSWHGRVVFSVPTAAIQIGGIEMNILARLLSGGVARRREKTHDEEFGLRVGPTPTRRVEGRAFTFSARSRPLTDGAAAVPVRL